MGNLNYYFFYAEEITENHTTFTGHLKMSDPIKIQLVTGSLSKVFEFSSSMNPKECFQETLKILEESHPDRNLKIKVFTKL